MNGPEIIYERLLEHYPDAKCALDFSSPLELLIATLLSAQTTDKMVNQVTKELFEGKKTVEDYRKYELDEIKRIIHPLGFFNTKAEHLKGLFDALAESFEGKVPSTMEELTELPGVGRKTASVVLSNAFGIPAMPVDTHVFRVSARLGLSEGAKDPAECEKMLKEAYPEDEWIKLHHMIIEHGRKVCSAKKPACGTCFMRDICPGRIEK